jgi:hypothetical protein
MANVADGVGGKAMKGFLYRLAMRLKEFGERHNLWVFINAGLALREHL